MQSVRSVIRALCALTAVILASVGPLVAVAPVAQASTGQFLHQSARTGSAVSQPLSISITGMTPATATPDATITVTGTLTNETGAALSGISVQAATSTEGFQYPSEMTDFTNDASADTSPLPLELAGEEYSVPDAVPNGATVTWSVQFPADEFYGQFGVFPVQVQAESPYTSAAATARTFLPYWPGSDATQAKGLQVAWVWPLIDTPQQGACPQTLATSELAGSVSSGGRLSTLLGAGSTWTQKDDLTWAVDPALLSDVSVMTKQYFTNGSAACSGRFVKQASPAAGTWLSQLKASLVGAPAFLTPYANVDAAALSHAGLDGNLKAAYQLGDAVASQILPSTFGKTGTGPGDGQVLNAAWPTGGQADAGVLTSLNNDGGVNTVVLSSTEQSSSAPGEDALGKTTSGVGGSMSVLFANSRITSLLGTASSSASASNQFNLTQDFLAQTAMIAAETDTERTLVIAPPTNWDPSSAEANALLSVTQSAPWLHPTGLSALAKEAAALPSETHIAPKQVSGAELSDAYMDKIASVSENVALFKDLLYKPSVGRLNSLTAALSVTASSAWRDGGSPGGWRAVGQLTDYLKDSENKIRLIASKKILLYGTSGETAVSVQNELGEAIQVQVMATSPTGSSLQVGPYNSPITVPAGGSSTVRMPVSSSTIGTTTVQLQLATESGAPLSWTSQPLSVEVTRFGRSLLIIIGGALGILVLTSVYRLRRKRLAGAKRDGNADETAEAGGTG
jgi:Family of unknown function (DUF6049)